MVCEDKNVVGHASTSASATSSSAISRMSSGCALQEKINKALKQDKSAETTASLQKR